MDDFRFYSNRVSEIRNEKHQRRRALLSDIKFMSMVPEISRSADHLFHAEGDHNPESSKKIMAEPRHEPSAYYFSGYVPTKMSNSAKQIVCPISPEVSRWSVEENRFGIPGTYFFEL